MRGRTDSGQYRFETSCLSGSFLDFVGHYPLPLYNQSGLVNSLSLIVTDALPLVIGRL